MLVILALTLLGRFGATAQDLKDYVRYFSNEGRWEDVSFGFPGSTSDAHAKAEEMWAVLEIKDLWKMSMHPDAVVAAYGFEGLVHKKCALSVILLMATAQNRRVDALTGCVVRPIRMEEFVADRICDLGGTWMQCKLLSVWAVLTRG